MKSDMRLEQAKMYRDLAARASVPQTRDEFLNKAKALETPEKKDEIKVLSKKGKTRVKFSVPSGFSGRVKSKNLIKSPSRATIVVARQPGVLSPYQTDRSRFFNQNYEADRRQLFFS